MTNPNNIVRVRARNGGRASVYEANAWAQGFSMGILEGYGVTQNTSADMNVLVGGSATKPDVLIAQNPAGYKIALDIIGRQAVAITAPASNSRISAIVAYTNDLSLSTTQDDVTGSPASCGLIVVNGTAAANPVAPTDSQIRTAITSDGATGSQAAYCVIATIKVASNTTMITNSLISTNQAAIGSKNIDFRTSIAYSKISNTTTYSDETTMATIEIPSTGKYYIEAIVGGIATSDSASQWRIKKGSTAFVANTFNHITRDGTARFSGSIATITDCAVGDEIILTAEILYGGGGTATARDGQYFLATRIS